MSPSHNSSRLSSSAAALFDWTPSLPPHITDPRCLQLCPSPDPVHNWPRRPLGAPSPPSLSRTARGHTSVSRAQERQFPFLHRRLYVGRPSIGVWCRAHLACTPQPEMKSDARGFDHPPLRAAKQRGRGDLRALDPGGLIGVIRRTRTLSSRPASQIRKRRDPPRRDTL